MATYTPWSVVYNEQPSAAKWNIIGSNMEYFQGSIVPIGAVMFLWGNSQSVSGAYLVCNGQVINDFDSPLNGLQVPNLLNKFVRGVQGNVRLTPQNGGEDSVILSTAQMPSHNHYINDPGHSHSTSNGSSSHSHSLRWLGINGPTYNASALYFVMSRAFNSLDNIYNTDSASSQSNVSIYSSNTGITIGSAGSGQGHNNVPEYVGLIPVMRYK